ncbi:2077_t:CDS:2 [Gigaspora rosea]|nr:2077_t:CDS:2 [Gigaspora rosea]
MFANILSGLKKNEKNKKTKKNKGKEAVTNERSSESFVERIEIAEERSPLPSSYENSHSFEEQVSGRTINKILENQGSILRKLDQVMAKVDRIDDYLDRMDQKLADCFDKTNEKDFIEPFGSDESSSDESVSENFNESDEEEEREDPQVESSNSSVPAVTSEDLPNEPEN